MNKLIYTIIIACFVALMFIANTSATGLRINQTSISFNKTLGSNAPFSFTLFNDQNFTFYNITFLSSDVDFPQINELPANTGVNINAVLKKDLTGLNSILVKGLYYNNLGQPFKEYKINITNSPPYLSTCDLGLIVGDSIIWNNQVLDNVVMETTSGIPVEGGTIAPNSSIKNTFAKEGTLNYRFKRSGFVFTPNCLITTVNASGLVNNQLYDTVLDFNVNLKYEDTIISTYALTTNYTMDFNSEQEGLMSITNTGNKTAYKVHLSGEWFSFNTNDFDLTAGQTKGILYKITPIITSSNQTGVTYNKQIYTSGNFQTMSNSISIKINSANIGTGNNTDADYLINIFCPRYPNSTLCNPAPRVEYRYIDNSSAKGFNVTITQQQYEDIWAFLFSTVDEQRVSSSTIKEMIYSITNNQNMTTSDLNTLRLLIEEDKKNRDKSSTNILIFVGVAFTLLTLTVGGALIYLNKKKKMIESQRRF